jgi:hypothetical protein
MDTADKKCPDCGRPMKAIRLVDNTKPVVGWGIPGQGELTYTVPEAKRSIWTGVLPSEGRVAACMCEGCGRILLHGEPRETAGE